MHKIGDNVMYGANGVMTIVDIREESIGDVSRSYYVITPAIARSDSLTFVPTDNEKLVGAMRPLLTKDQALALILGMKNPGYIDWIPENRPRSEFFKRILESGEREMMVAMIHAINESAKRREAEGKKNFLSDENAKQKAEKILYSEFSIVFEIPEDQVGSYINNLLG